MKLEHIPRPAPKIKRYYVLRLVSVVYKLFSVLTVIVAIPVIGWFWMDISYGNHPDRYSPFVGTTWILQSLTMIIAAGLLSLTFAVLGQLLDLLIEMNENMRIIAARQERPHRPNTTNSPRESINVPVINE